MNKVVYNHQKLNINPLRLTPIQGHVGTLIEVWERDKEWLGSCGVIFESLYTHYLVILIFIVDLFLFLFFLLEFGLFPC